MSRPKIGVLVHFTSVFAHFRVFIVVADIQYGGDLESSENFLHVGYHFFRFLLQRFEKNWKTLCRDQKLAFWYFLHQFLPILEYFWWLQTLTMGVIWNPEKISYMLETELLNLYGNDLKKIGNGNFESKNSFFCIFKAVFVHFKVFILVLDL